MWLSLLGWVRLFSRSEEREREGERESSCCWGLHTGGHSVSVCHQREGTYWSREGNIILLPLQLDILNLFNLLKCEMSALGLDWWSVRLVIYNGNNGINIPVSPLPLSYYIFLSLLLWCKWLLMKYLTPRHEPFVICTLKTRSVLAFILLELNILPPGRGYFYWVKSFLNNKTNMKTKCIY